MQPLSRSTLNKTDLELLESVLAKDVHSLSPDDILILKARRQYLTYTERQAYGELIPDDIQEAVDQQTAAQDTSKLEYHAPSDEKEKIDSALQQGQPQQPVDPASPAAPGNQPNPNADTVEENPFAPDPNQTQNA
jgi:hypothetical protein